MGNSIADYSSAVAWAVDKVGGPVSAAKICGVSRTAVDKWISKGTLPRTEYTGESKHAERLAAASGGAFTASDLLKPSVPVAPAEQINPRQEQQPQPEGFVERRRPGAQSHAGIRTGRRFTDATVREQIVAIGKAAKGEFPE
ncbi:helix-turn-helix domain-containing protein [Pseudomonas sp. PS1]|uniref:Helix-turn-helix domain-containing protein n=1 Tax=Stutzerimonas marianensis TaxID=2929513 RepID=A0A9X2AQU3_9GAMM|nr:helix-turn-helix domain-containing protein [Pseudomonas marianensis]MCJ0972708.1 helix-turn-helix domain-containing protein [Pseudomonas marianensis]